MNLLVFSVSAETSGDCGDNATWSLSDDGVLTISGSGAIRDYIYEGANLWPLIKAPWRDHSSKVKKIVINSGITSIGDNAFCCLPNVTSVSIPKTVTSIGQAAFCDMKSLTQITIPNSVTTMEKSVFHKCTSLSKVTLPSGLTVLPESTFKSCSALKSISLPSGITVIQGSAFKSSGLTTITIPDGVVSIGSYAFQYCGDLTTVKLPSSLQEIRPQAFSSSGITSIVFPRSLQSISRSFVWCHNLKSICFEGNAPEIDKYAFENVTATAYYPIGNTTWTENACNHYDGNLTWVAYCSNGHTWKQWITEREPTCAVAGLKMRSCTQCDMTEEESIAKIPHQCESVVTPPTCKDDGFTAYTCKACNYTYQDNIVSAGAHAFGEWIIITEATCMEKGSKRHSCIACDVVETEEIELAEHTYTDEVTAPSCTQEGFTTHICSVCAHTFVDSYTAITEHSYGEWIADKPATLRKEGEQHRQCVVCSATQTEIIPKNTISWGLIIGMIAAGVVAGMIVAVVFFKKKHPAK